MEVRTNALLLYRIDPLENRVLEPCISVKYEGKHAQNVLRSRIRYLVSILQKKLTAPVIIEYILEKYKRENDSLRNDKTFRFYKTEQGFDSDKLSYIFKNAKDETIEIQFLVKAIYSL